MPPESNISFEELMVLWEEALAADSFRIAYGGVISVALHGTVSSSFPNPNPKTKRHEVDDQISAERNRLNFEKFEELKFLLDRANRVVRKLGAVVYALSALRPMAFDLSMLILDKRAIIEMIIVISTLGFLICFLLLLLKKLIFRGFSAPSFF